MIGGRPQLLTVEQHGDTGNPDALGPDAAEYPFRDDEAFATSYAFGENSHSRPIKIFKGHITGMRDLAVEVLIHIFRQVVPTSRRHIRLTHVCRLWRTIILDIPEFWARMLAVPDFFTYKLHGLSVELWYQFMERGGPVPPLELQLRGSSLYLLETIPQHLPRLSYLRVQYRPDDISALHSRFLAMGPLPALHTFICTRVVGRSKQNCQSYQDDLKVIEFPRLRHLEFDPMCFSVIERIAAPYLETLIVHRGDLSPLKLLLALAGRYARLEVLRVYEVDAVYSGLQGSSVRLSQLREWSMTGRNHQDWWVQCMLSHIECPPTTGMTIWTSYGWLSNHLCPYFPLFIEDRRGRCLYSLRFDEGSRKEVLSIEAYVAKDKSPRFRMSTTDIAWGVGNKQLEDVARASVTYSIVQTFFKSPVDGITTLELWLSPRGEVITHARWKTLLEAFSGLRSLTVRVPSCRSLLKVLRRYVVSRNLGKLDITCNNGTGVYRALAKTVEERLDDGLRLRYLGFYHQKNIPRFPDKLLGRICSVVPEVAVGTF